MTICLHCGGENRHLGWCHQHQPLTPVYTHTRARKTDPTTSHDAGTTVTTTTINRTQQLIIDTLRNEGPCTDEELCQHIAAATAQPVSVSGIRTRRSELVTAGIVVDTDTGRPTRTGRMAIVWGIK